MSGLIALAIAMGIGRFAFTPVLPMMQVDAGLTIAQGGWLASANYVGYLAGALTALALRWSHGAMIRAGLAMVTVTTLAMATVDVFTAWFVLRFAAGLASAWVLVYVSSWGFAHPETVFSGVGGGIAIAGLACFALSAIGSGSDVAWVVLGMLALAGTAMVWRTFALPHATMAGSAPAPFHWSAQASRLAVAYGAFGFGYIIPATFLPAMARELIGDPLLFGLSWPVFGAAAAASTFFAGPLRRRFDDRRVWIGAQTLMAVGVAVLPISALPALLRTTLSAALVGGTFMVVTMTGIQEARRIGGPSGARAVIAMLTAAFATGQVVGPLVVAATGDYALSLSIAAGLLLAGALLLRR